jgi:hypothetical protein
VTAYAAAEEIHLELLIADLAKQGLYEVSKLPSDIEDSIYVRARYQIEEEPREFFVYRYAGVFFVEYKGGIIKERECNVVKGSLFVFYSVSFLCLGRRYM